MYTETAADKDGFGLDDAMSTISVSDSVSSIASSSLLAPSAGIARVPIGPLDAYLSEDNLKFQRMNVQDNWTPTYLDNIDSPPRYGEGKPGAWLTSTQPLKGTRQSLPRAIGNEALGHGHHVCSPLCGGSPHMHYERASNSSDPSLMQTLLELAPRPYYAPRTSPVLYNALGARVDMGNSKGPVPPGLLFDAFGFPVESLEPYPAPPVQHPFPTFQGPTRNAYGFPIPMDRTTQHPGLPQATKMKYEGLRPDLMAVMFEIDSLRPDQLAEYGLTIHDWAVVGREVSLLRQAGVLGPLKTEPDGEHDEVEDEESYEEDDNDEDKDGESSADSIVSDDNSQVYAFPPYEEVANEQYEQNPDYYGFPAPPAETEWDRFAKRMEATTKKDASDKPDGKAMFIFRGA